jgi:hypothetical protein
VCIPRYPTTLSSSELDRINIDNSGWLTYVAGDTLAALGEVSTTVFTSVLRDMLLQNVDNVNQSGILTNTDSMNLRGVAESMEALADQRLFGSAGAQLMIEDRRLAGCNCAARSYASWRRDLRSPGRGGERYRGIGYSYRGDPHKLVARCDRPEYVWRHESCNFGGMGRTRGRC